MKKTFHVFASLAVCMCLVTSIQTLKAQSTPVANGSPKSQVETVALQRKAEATITHLDWNAKMRVIDARKLENLERWHQFPLGKMIKQNANASNQDLTTAIQAWYNEKPADRAKIIISFE